MSHRVIKGLKWVTICGTPAFAAGKKRLRGAKARGIKYQDDVGKALGCNAGSSWVAGQWFHFLDKNGLGYAQVDFMSIRSDAIVVMEAKLSWCPEAHTQLEQLYRPLIEMAFSRSMIGLVITRRVTPDCKGAVAQTLGSALQAAKSCRNIVLHWCCKAPLLPGPPKPRAASGPPSAAALTL